MVGELIEIAFFMMVLALFSFAPLGYFIYLYTMKKSEPFSHFEEHGPDDVKEDGLTEKLINSVLGLFEKK